MHLNELLRNTLFMKGELQTKKNEYRIPKIQIITKIFSIKYKQKCMEI